MRIDQCKDIILLTKMKQALDCQMKRIAEGSEEKSMDEISELSLESLKINFRLEELQEELQENGLTGTRTPNQSVMSRLL